MAMANALPAGKPTIDFLRMCYRANLPPLLTGRHGIGKSEIFRQAAEACGIDFIVRDLSLMEPPDLVGLPRPDKSDGRTVYAPPAFLPQGGQGIILFEELNRSESYMRAPCLQLLTERALNDYRLPEGWLPAAAINPEDEDYAVYEMDEALRSRFVEAKIVPDWDEWLEWARRQKLHPEVIRYIATDSTVFNEPESNPRAWQYVSDWLATAQQEEAPEKILRNGLVGLVGPNRAIAFLQHLQQEDAPLTVDDVLSSYPEHRAAVRSLIADGKLDRIKMTLLAVKRHLQPEFEFERIREDEDQWANLGRFLNDLPGDLYDEAHDFFDERDYPLPEVPNN